MQYEEWFKTQGQQILVNGASPDEFAKAAWKSAMERAAALCRQHAEEPMIMRIAPIDECLRAGPCIDCATIIENETRKI